AVLFDVDFTLCRPGPEVGPEAYQRLGLEHGLRLDPARYDEARAAAIVDLKKHPELDHDEEIWIRFTEDRGRGVGGRGPRVAEIACESPRRWHQAGSFELSADALPVLRELRGQGLKLGPVSTTSRDLGAFVRHFDLDVDGWISSGAHGKV